MTTLLTILTENFADWECAMAMAAGRSYYGFDVLTATPDCKPVTSAGGLKVTSDKSLAEVDPASLDALLVCGGRTWESEDMPNISNLLRAVHDRGGVIGAICAATRGLAASGLLDAIPHTSNSLDTLKDVPGYAGAAHYVDTPGAVSAERIVTAPGTASFAFMAEVMAALGRDRSELEFYIGMHAAQFTKAA